MVLRARKVSGAFEKRALGLEPRALDPGTRALSGTTAPPVNMHDDGIFTNKCTCQALFTFAKDSRKVNLDK